jgi:co-chaperonin GroES (HSP10)
MGVGVKPKGPWILVKTDPSPEMSGSLYLPGNSVAEKIGHSTGTVLETGDGIPSTPKQYKASGKKYQEHEVRKGDRIVFRTYLQNANRPSQLDRDRCLLHVGDILGVLVG